MSFHGSSPWFRGKSSSRSATAKLRPLKRTRSYATRDLGLRRLNHPGFFLIANRTMWIYRRFRSDQVLNIGNYLCPTSGDRLVRCQMGSEAEVADYRARWRLRSGLKQQLLKSGLGL